MMAANMAAKTDLNIIFGDNIIENIVLSYIKNLFFGQRTWRN